MPLLACPAVRSTTEQGNAITPKGISGFPCIDTNWLHGKKHCWASQQWHTRPKTRCIVTAAPLGNAVKDLCGECLEVLLEVEFMFGFGEGQDGFARRWFTAVVGFVACFFFAWTHVVVEDCLL